MSSRRLTTSENFEECRCPVTFGFNKNGKTKLIYCGQWSCPQCAKRLSRKWAQRIKEHIQKGEIDNETQWYMLTLTLGSRYTDPTNAYKALRKLWNRLRMAINRSNSDHKWQYAAFVEGQPKRQSMPHFHIIMDIQPPAGRNKKSEITKHALHNWTNSMGWGYQSDLGRVNHDKAAAYVAKYVSKGSAMVPRGFRRVRVSMGWTKLKVDPARRLIVMRRGESVIDYILRVGEFTGIDHNDLINAYFEGKQALALANLTDE